MQVRLHFPNRGPRRALLFATAGLLVVPALPAQTTSPATAASEPAVAREEIVISASRSRQDPKYAASSVTLLSLSALDESQIVDLPRALGREPGVAIVSTGATGSQASIFLRGASSHQTLLFVDGVRMNDRSAAYPNYLGGADLGGVGRLEVLRGPQGTLYGSAAMGGVIALDTLPVGEDRPSGRVSATGGSFGTGGASLEARGGAGALGYSASTGYLETENDDPFNNYRVWNHAARVEFAPASGAFLIGATLRRQDADYEQPGSTVDVFSGPGLIDSGNTLITGYAEVRPFGGLASRLTLALHERDYRYEAVPNLWGTYVSYDRREILDWINTWSASDQLELVAGANVERSRSRSGTESSRDDVAAAYVSGIYRIQESLTVTAGARLDDFDSFGSATTGRLGVAWNATESTKLRATYATGFSAPSSTDRFGLPPWQLANPALDAERVRGWDVGVDHAIHGGDITLQATWFHHRYRSLLEFDSPASMVVNRDRATTRGLETAAAVRVTRAIETRLSYTYVHAYNNTDDVRLARRPRHTIDAEVTARPARAWLVGGGVHAVVDRVDGPRRLEDYTTVRVFGSYRASEDILLKLRVENAFDEEYEEVAGYPALPFGVFGGIEWSF